MAMPTDRLPEGDEKRAAVRSMFDTIAPRYDLINRIMTFRMDVGWRKKALNSLQLTPASTVLDLASGTGDFSVELDERGHRPIGIDLSFGMLANTRSSAPRIQGDLLDLSLADQSVDAAVCGYALRNLVSLPPFFAELFRTVKPGGRIALLDVSAPDNKVLGFGYNIYFGKVVPLIGGLLSDKTAYAYLPKSLSYLPPREEMLTMLEAAGFTHAEHKQLSGGLSQLITAVRP